MIKLKHPIIKITLSLFAFLIGAFAWLVFSLGGFHPNQAEKTFMPIADELSQMGGTKLCDNGDNGFGIDNNLPWYEVYFEVPDTPNLTQHIKDIVGKQGYSLTNDSDFITQMKNNPDNFGVYNSNSDYLIGQKDKDSLRVTINRQTTVSLRCTKDYGNQKSTGAKNAILDFSLSTPRT